MFPRFRKAPFPVENVRRYLEPGPIVLVSSAWKGQRNIMVMGWHTVMEFSPSLVGCVISSANHSFEMLRRSRQCVINLPTTALTEAVVGIGTSSGADADKAAGKFTDKFERFGLNADPARKVDAPLIRECFASFECHLADSRLINRYNFFIWEVVAAHVATSPKHPETLHYQGNGTFMVAGKIIHRRRLALL